MNKLVDWQKRIASLASLASEALNSITTCMDASANGEEPLKVEGLVLGFMNKCRELRSGASATWLNSALDYVNWPNRRKWFNDFHSYFEKLPSEILTNQQTRLDVYFELGRFMTDLCSIRTRLGVIVPRPKATDAKQEARDEWIYRQCMEGAKYTALERRLKELASKHGWRSVTYQRIPMIAKEYAARHDLAPPPPRQDK